MVTKKIILGFLLGFSFVSCEKSNCNSFLFWGFTMGGFPITNERLEKQEVETRIAPEVIVFYLQWPEVPSTETNIKDSLETIWNRGSLPCLTWEPMFFSSSSKEEQAISFETILDGTYDSYLISIAKQIKLWNNPIIIRFAHEMNLQRYHWGTTKENFGSKSPEIYIRLFQYLVNVFKKENVSNVFWAFCPNNQSVPNEAWNKSSDYYPGDDFVDILGMDGYNWNISKDIALKHHYSWISPYQSFEELFKQLYEELKKLSPHKPIIVFETASVDRSEKQKSLWIKEALATAMKWELKGIIWFQLNKEEDWRVNQNDDSNYVPLIRSATSPFQHWLFAQMEEGQKDFK